MRDYRYSTTLPRLPEEPQMEPWFCRGWKNVGLTTLIMAAVFVPIMMWGNAETRREHAAEAAQAAEIRQKFAHHQAKISRVDRLIFGYSERVGLVLVAFHLEDRATIQIEDIVEDDDPRLIKRGDLIEYATAKNTLDNSIATEAHPVPNGF